MSIPANPTADPTAGMSLGQQTGQLFMVGFAGTSAPPHLLDLIATQHAGGIILFARNLRDAAQTLALTHALQRAARAAGHPAPLLIATDQENGIVRRLGRGSIIFPGQMAQGAIGDEAVARTIARATGEQLRARGITMNLAPSIDVASNPANPVIGVRAFGADPALVARLGTAALGGYREAGVAPTLKHFPGHGDTTTDSHLALPVIPHDMKRLERVELFPFRQGITAGASVVMTAHIAVPALTGSDTLPATLAPEVIQGLLRERLGFEGVVMTDCLEMNAISATVGVAAGAVRALQAGVDLALVSHRHDRQVAALDAVRAAVANGTLAPDRVREAAARVLRLKQHLCTWADWDAAMERAETVNSMPVANAAHQALADLAYARATTLIRDDAPLLPLRRDTAGRVLVVALTGAPVNQAAGERSGEAGARALAAALRRRQIAVETVVLSSDLAREALDELTRHSHVSDAIVVLTQNAYRHPQHVRALLPALVAAQQPLVGVAVGDPYDAAALPEIGTWLATYEDTAPALEAVAGVLLGERVASGMLPVPLPALPQDGAASANG